MLMAAMAGGTAAPGRTGMERDTQDIVFEVNVEPDEEDGGYVASVSNLRGVYGQGETREEAWEDLKEALDFTIRDMIENGEPLPESDESARHLPSIEDSAGKYRADMVF